MNYILKDFIISNITKLKFYKYKHLNSLSTKQTQFSEIEKILVNLNKPFNEQEVYNFVTNNAKNSHLTLCDGYEKFLIVLA